MPGEMLGLDRAILERVRLNLSCWVIPDLANLLSLNFSYQECTGKYTYYTHHFGSRRSFPPYFWFRIYVFSLKSDFPHPHANGWEL